MQIDTLPIHTLPIPPGIRKFSSVGDLEATILCESGEIYFLDLETFAYNHPIDSNLLAFLLHSNIFS